MRIFLFFLCSFISFAAQATLEVFTDHASQKISFDNPISYLTYSGNRAYFSYAFTNDSIVTLQNLNRQILHTFKHNSPVLTAYLSHNGQVLLTGESNGMATLWSKEGERLHKFRHNAPVTTVAISPSDQFVLTGSQNSQLVTLWKREESGHFWSSHWKVMQFFKTENPIVTIDFFTGDDQILLVSTKEVGLWKVGNNRATSLGQLEFPTFITTPAIFSPDKKKLLIATQKRLYLYDVSSGRLKAANHIKTFPIANSTALAFSPDGQLILVGLSNGETKLLTLEGEELVTYKSSKITTPIKSVAFSPDGEKISIGQSQYIYTFNHQVANSKSSLFQFEPLPEEQGLLTFAEVATMSRLGVKIRYEDEETLHPLSASDSPQKVTEAVELDLSNLYLDYLPVWLGKFKKLRFLDLSENRLSLQKLNVLRGMTNLENINLSSNPIFQNLAGAGELFKPLKNLFILNLEDTNLKETDLQTLGLSDSLLKLYISKNKLINLSLANLPHLLEIQAIDNKITSLKLENIPNLEKVDFRNNQLKKLDFTDFPERVREIDVAHNLIEQVLFSREHDLPLLEKLDLSHNNALSSLPDSMSDIFMLQNLRLVDVGDNVKIPDGLRLKLESFKKK